MPDDASVTATYGSLPHLSHREQIYDWPNPFVPSYWGNDDGYRLPDPSTIDYLVLDRRRSARRSASCSPASSTATPTGSCSTSRTSSWPSALAPG